MAQVIDLGRIRFYFKGEYDALVSYELNDVIKYGGGSYVYTSTLSSIGNNPTDTDYWAKMTDGFQWENTYSASTNYQENDVVVYGPQTFIALQDTIGNVPTNATYWKVFTGGIGFKGNWATATVYYPNDVVRRGASLYIAINTHTSSAAFATDAAQWGEFTRGVRDTGVWETLTTYLKDDLVNDGVNSYIATMDHVSGAGLFSQEPAGRWEGFVAGADYLPPQTGLSSRLLSTDGVDPVWVNNISIDDASFGTNEHFVGADAQAMSTALQLTDYSAVFSSSAGGNSEAFAQLSMANSNPDGYGSTDIIAYPYDGNNLGGYIDMGIAGANFDSETYGITGPHDGYIFVVAPEGTTGNGNLVFATGDTGLQNNIVFAAGGLTSGTTQMQIIPDTTVHIEIATESTSPTTGAFVVAGGVGVQGNLNVLGNQEVIGDVVIQGSISVAGGQFVTENLSSTDPLLFVGNLNEGNAFDLGFMTEAKQPTSTSNFIFNKKAIATGVATLTAATYNATVKQISSGTGILTVGADHGFAIGDTIIIAGVDATFNGTRIITDITATQVKFALSASDLASSASSGTVQFKILTGDRQALQAGDFLTLSGVGSNLDGAKHLSYVSDTIIRFTTTEANLSTTAISPTATGTRNSRSKFSGLVKDNADGTWHVFSNLEVRPTSTVDFTLPEIYYDNITVGRVNAKRGFNNFANIAERDTMIPSPVRGTIVFMGDTLSQQFYTGSKWETIDPVDPMLLMGV
jgi:hypothetical protein